MGKRIFKVTFILILSLSLTGCFVRTYTITKERVDQDISGNRGCLQGDCSYIEKEEVKSSTREIAVMEIEFSSPVKFGFGKGEPKAPPKEKTKDIEGNLGYLAGGPDESLQEDILPLTEAEKEPSFTEYKVKRGDTLQKISKKFYGTYSKWMKIYNANKDKIKSPNDISRGQILNIPEE